jgi:hypothetical protein
MSALDSWTERARRRGESPPKPAARPPAPMTMDAARKRWLGGMLAACLGSPRLNGWEQEFTAGIRQRMAEQGDDFVLSEKQFAVLWRIDEKVHAAG